MLLSNFSPKIVASDWCEWSLFNVIHVPYILLEQLFNKCFVWKQLFSKQMILSKRGLSAIVWNEIFFLKAYHWAQGFGVAVLNCTDIIFWLWNVNVSLQLSDVRYQNKSENNFMSIRGSRMSQLLVREGWLSVTFTPELQFMVPWFFKCFGLEKFNWCCCINS